MKKQSLWSRLFIGIVLFTLYLPIFCVVVFSFNAGSSSIRWGGFTLDWYFQLLHDRELKGALATSLTVAVASVLISVVIGTLGAVSLDRLRPGYRRMIYGLSYIPLIIPEIILGIALLMFFSILPIQYGLGTLILSHTVFCIPYIFIMALIRLRSIDPSISEAARDLGAKRSQLFFTITLPLIAPAVFSGAMLALAMSLDDVIISFFMAGPTSTTLPVKIFSMLKLGVSPKINALCTILLAATFIIVGFSQTAGSNKEREADPID